MFLFFFFFMSDKLGLEIKFMELIWFCVIDNEVINKSKGNFIFYRNDFVDLYLYEIDLEKFCLRSIK